MAEMTPEEAGKLLDAMMTAKLAPLGAMLAGYQTALMAILLKLDAAGALPAIEAKAAIDGAYAALTDEKQKSGQGLVLRQLSEHLEMRQAGRPRRH